jgi:hypothetical protein
MDEMDCFFLTKSGKLIKKMTVKVIHRIDDGGSTHLWNVGLLQQDYTEIYIAEGCHLQ